MDIYIFTRPGLGNGQKYTLFLEEMAHWYEASEELREVHARKMKLLEEIKRFQDEHIPYKQYKEWLDDVRTEWESIPEEMRRKFPRDAKYHAEKLCDYSSIADDNWLELRCDAVLAHEHMLNALRNEQVPTYLRQTIAHILNQIREIAGTHRSSGRWRLRRYRLKRFMREEGIKNWPADRNPPTDDEEDETDTPLAIQ